MSLLSRIPRSRHRRPLVALAGRAGGHVRLVGLLTFAVMAGIAYIIILSVNGVPFQKRHTLYVLVRGETPSLDVAMQVRVNGERAGIVLKSEPTREGARLKLAVDDGFWPLGATTGARIRVRPATGLVYVELEPAGTGQLAEDATIPAARVSASTTLPQVAEAFDASTRHALATSSMVAGAALADQGRDINVAIGQLRASVDDSLPLLHALTAKPGQLSDLIAQTGTVAHALAANPAALDATLTDGRTLLHSVAQRTGALADTVELAPDAERQMIALAPRADAVLGRASTLMDALGPFVDQTTTMLPDVRSLLLTGSSLRGAVNTLVPVAQQTLGPVPAALKAMVTPVSLLKPTTDALNPTIKVLDAYQPDLVAGVKGLEAVTTKPYKEGVTAPGNPALRFMPILTCHRARNPYPAPGQALRDGGPEAVC